MDLAIPTADGAVLHGRLWPGTDPRGVLVIAHGIGEHGGCYEPVAALLAGMPGLVDVLTFDFRGHGRSPGRRGVIRHYDELTADLRAALAWAARERPGRPRFVLGHSNGGQVALRVALEMPDALAGLVLSNPILALAARVPGWKLRVGRLLHRFAPHVTLTSGLDHGQMTRDAASWPARQADPLRHARISAPLFFGMVEGGAALARRAPEVRLPTLLILGGADPVVDPAAGRAFFEALGAADKTLRLYPEMRHEPLNELGREHVHADLVAWLAERLDRP